MVIANGCGDWLAVVLAAGSGTRLGTRTGAVPKPLVPLAGRPLVMHTLSGLAAAGISEVAIVTGYRGDDLRRELACMPALELQFAHNDQYRRGASFSLRAAREFARDRRFLLTMSDHLLSADLLGRLCEAGDELEDRGAVALVAADRSNHWPREYVDEATRVAVDADGRVVSIGKDLEHWDALDTGAFACSPAIWDYVDRAPEDCDLSTIFRLAAADGAMGIADVTGAWWYDVDTEEDLAAAGRLLEGA